MYRVKKEFAGLGAKVILRSRFMGKTIIEIDKANEVELEYLFELEHPYIEKVNKTKKVEE